MSSKKIRETAIDDSELARRIRRGDPAALAAAYDAHAASVFRHARSLLGSPDDAEDVLSEVFLRLTRSRGWPIRNLRAYLLTISRRESFRLLRRRSRECLTDPALLVEESHASTTIGRANDEIRETLENLPPEQREVVTLKLLEGMTFAEIARICRIPPGTAASRYRRAIANLKEALVHDALV